MDDEIYYDIYQAWKLSIGLERSQKYSKVYLNSNENLEELFKQISVKDKDVLTVLSSSDQYFRCLYNGARSVDTFDINVFPKYYYYVRKWYMEINRKCAISKEMVYRSDQWFHELLPKIKCKSTNEEYAYKFWKKYIEEYQGKLGDLLFRLVEGDSNFDRAVDSLCEIIKDKPLNFSNSDICDGIETNKKYDVIILSNILEWYLFEPQKLKSCKSNLERLLKDDGKIVCSCVMDFDINSGEMEIFQDEFNYERIIDQNTSFSKNLVLGYSYQKKKI